MVRHAEPSGEPGDPLRHRRRAPATGPQRRCRRRSFHGPRLKLETAFVWSLWGNSFLDHEGMIVMRTCQCPRPESTEAEFDTFISTFCLLLLYSRLSFSEARRIRR